jgi:DNA-damage-inducible protein J
MEDAMGQTNVNIRMDADIKQEAEQLFESLGLNMSTAFNIFVRQSLRTGGIPFKVTTNDSGFDNRYNQMKLRAAVKRMNEGKGSVHDIVEESND